MNKKNLKYKNYFIKLNKTLNNFNNEFLFYIPELYKNDLRKDKNLRSKKNIVFFKNIFKKNYIIEDIKKIEKANTCFISHYVGSKTKDKDNDFYYGNFLKKLKKNPSFYLILINHTKENLVEIKKKFKGSNIARVYINNDFNIFFDGLNILRITKEFIFFKLSNLFSNNKIKFPKNLNVNFNYKNFLNSRYTYKITKSIINILDKSKNLDNLVTTFEGHAFEKVIFNYCKKRRIKSFGYFFSIIREYKNSIYYNFNSNYQPNVVFTSGEVAKKDLQINSPHKNIKILGSNKVIIKNNKLNILKHQKRFLTILVCPEGWYSETIQLLGLINNDLLLKKNLKFIFRTHPLINPLRDLNKSKINSNIFFSKEKDIKNDFKKSDIILYSGSSSCIQAVMSGLVPINYNNKENFSLDPLFKINKFIVEDALTLLNIIYLINKNKISPIFKKKLNFIQIYCESYFKKFDQDIFLKMIKK